MSPMRGPEERAKHAYSATESPPPKVFKKKIKTKSIVLPISSLPKKSPMSSYFAVFNPATLSNGAVFGVVAISVAFIAVVSTGIDLYNQTSKKQQDKWKSLKGFSILLLIGPIIGLVWGLYAAYQKGSGGMTANTATLLGVLSAIVLGTAAAFLAMYQQADSDTKKKFTGFRNFMIAFIVASAVSILIGFGYIGYQGVRRFPGSAGMFQQQQQPSQPLFEL